MDTHQFDELTRTLAKGISRRQMLKLSVEGGLGLIANHVFMVDSGQVLPSRREATSVAIVLSGGGARGDFEVGALRFLYNQGIRPDIICGTSVGAINGAKLAEGEGFTDQGLQGLERIWLSLQTNADMYLEEDWLNTIDPRIKDYFVGKSAILTIQGPQIYSEWGDLNVLCNFASKASWLPTEGQAILNALDKLSTAKSLYNLLPLEWRLRGEPGRGIEKQFSEQKVQEWSQAGNRKLRLAVVSLESGALRYVTESGQLLERDGKTPVLVQTLAPGCQQIADTIAGYEADRRALQDQLSDAAPGEKPALVRQIKRLNQLIVRARAALQNCTAQNPGWVPVSVPLLSGVLASAAMPGIFRAVRMGGETYIDGGVREIHPVQAAIDLGATDIYIIAASTGGTDSQLPYVGSFEQSSMLEIVGRALVDIAIDEVGLNETDPGLGWGTLHVKIIRPSFDIHDFKTIDPGLITIAMAYGYMRAADVISGVARDARLWQLANEIARHRVDTWETECIIHGQPVPTKPTEPPSTPNPDLLPALRTRKQELRALVDERRRLGGAVPVDADQWWQNWERHPWQPTEILWPQSEEIDAPAVCSAGPDRLDVFMRGADDGLYYQAFNGNNWTSWEALGGTLTSAPAAVALGPGLIYVFVRGTDNAFYYKWLSGGGRSDWHRLEGNASSAPAVCSAGPDRLDVFMRGADDGLYYQAFNGNNWTGWEALGGTLTSAPAAVALGPGLIYVFVRGTDNAFYYKWLSGGGRSDWHRLEGNASSAPAVCSAGPDRLDVLMRGADDGLYYQAFNGNNWTSWEALGGTLTSAPAAVALGPGLIYVFVRGTDNAFYYKWLSGGGRSDWHRLQVI